MLIFCYLFCKNASRCHLDTIDFSKNSCNDAKGNHENESRSLNAKYQVLLYHIYFSRDAETSRSVVTVRQSTPLSHRFFTVTVPAPLERLRERIKI
jgi:hypothetical protein